jgi:CrcB protein
MERFLWVCLGGAAGSGARYLLAGWVREKTGGGFPWGTLCVNVVGSFVLGAIVQMASTPRSLSATANVAMTVGVLGGFTTYSAFNQEMLESMQAGAWARTAAILFATVVGCLVCGFLGQAAARALFA